MGKRCGSAVRGKGVSHESPGGNSVRNGQGEADFPVIKRGFRQPKDGVVRRVIALGEGGEGFCRGGRGREVACGRLWRTT